MLAALLALFVETEFPLCRFEQVAPQPIGEQFVPSRNQSRAIVLMHGLVLHPFSEKRAKMPLMRKWQLPDSHTVRTLAKIGDVFSFAYSQTMHVDTIAERCGLLGYICELKRLGYKEIVLIGHSAGGVIARQFVEDHPDSGVTKLIQICARNGGSSWAKIAVVREAQREFVRSLTKESRARSLAMRREKRLPAHVEVVCLVGNGTGEGDGLVNCQCQWTSGLRAQGIPGLPLPFTHWRAMRNEKSIDQIKKHILTKYSRWQQEQIRMSIGSLFDR